MATSNQYRQSKNDLFWMAATVFLTLLFLKLAATNLANYYPVSGDDGWIMSASYKLASEAIFGSDMYTGFFNADRHYFIALPVYHFLQAASFKLFGLGVAQARLPNLFSAVLLIWIISGLARRHYGRKTALLSTALLIFLCPGLTTADPCAMLLVYAQNGRYDLTATTLVWAAVWQLDNYIRQPASRTAFTLGLITGLAVLTQFFGAFVLLPVAIVFLLRWGKNIFRRPTLYLAAAGFLLPTGAYLIYILAHFDDFIGQSVLKSGRANLLDPAFYLNNILREGERFTTPFQSLEAVLPAHLPFHAILSLIILTGVLAAFAILLNRERLNGKTSRTIPWISLLGFFLSLMLFEQTKAPIYAILLFPGICLALSAVCMAVFQLAKQLKQPWPLRTAIIVPLIVILASLFLSGISSHRSLIEVANKTTSYRAAAEQIKAFLPAGTVVLGSERWWPGLVDAQYLSLNNLWTQWRLAEEHGRSPDFSEQVRRISAGYMIVDIDVRGSLVINPERLQIQFRDYLSTCGRILADWEDRTYARIQIFQLNC